MAALRRTPVEYGLKIQDSVPGMLVTARNKMRSGSKLRIGFSGQGPATVTMYCDAERNGSNLAAVRDFVRHLDGLSVHRQVAGNLVWHGVGGRDVADRFFDRYRSPGKAWRVQGDALALYVRDRLAHAELGDWTVALISSGKPDAVPAALAGHPVRLTERAVLEGLEPAVNDGRYSIKQLLSPTHEEIDLSADQVAAAFKATLDAYQVAPGRRKQPPTRAVGWALRAQRPRERGLLLLYPLKPPAPVPGVPQTVTLTQDPVMGFLASFPASPGAPAVDYVVNRVFTETFGDDDWDDEDPEDGG